MKNYFTLHNSIDNAFYCYFPDKCPFCQKTICPKHEYDYFNDIAQQVTLVFSCPACHQCFISHYKLSISGEEYLGQIYRFISLTDTFPKTPEYKTFEKSIVSLSPDFCKIYNQALASETYNLTTLTGVGYRKALEFLIKDYCVFKNSDEIDKINNMPLGQVIDKYIDNRKIQNLAKAATWLGNDETHYIRKYEDKDLQDLKKFIDTTVAFINYELVSDEAEEFTS